MAFSRYNSTPRINMGRQYGTQRSMQAIYRGVQAGLIGATKYVVSEDERLDILAGQFYSDARLWWVIAAASGIGWNLQVPPGIVLTIPSNVGQIQGMIG